MNIKFSIDTQTRVRYSETDQMGYVYYGNYATYFEIGRVECLRSLGLPYKEIEEQGIMLPVMDLTVNYKYPAKYDDKLTIRTTIKSLDGCKIYFEYSITNESEKLICTGSTHLVFVNKENMRPIRPSQEIIKLLSPYQIHE